MQTIGLVIIDYEMDKHSETFETLSPTNDKMIQKFQNLLGNDNDNGDEIIECSATEQIAPAIDENKLKHWENEIDKRTKELENAQCEHTKDPTEEIQMLKDENKSKVEISKYRKEVRIF